MDDKERVLSARRQTVEERDRERGYAISYKQLGLAFVAEAFVIAASLYGAYLFALQYGHNDIEIKMMMLAPIGYAIIELARVPLALAVRTQPNPIWKVVALIGVLCAAGVTVKSMSQLGEIMFRPRLIDVVQAKQGLVAARNDQESLGAKIDAAQKIVDQRQAQLGEAEARVKTVNEQIGQLPPPTCVQTVSRDKKGGVRKGLACSKDQRAPVLAASLDKAQADRDAASKALDEARGQRGLLDPGATDKAVTAAELAHRKAVMNSQLHSFTAMAFGVDPTDVTDGQVHTFLRLFVFLPAIFVSLAATLLAMTAVRRIKTLGTVTIPDGALESLIGPFANEVMARAAAASEQRVVAMMEAAAKLPPPAAVIEAVAAKAAAAGELEPPKPDAPAAPAEPEPLEPVVSAAEASAPAAALPEPAEAAAPADQAVTVEPPVDAAVAEAPGEPSAEAAAPPAADDGRPDEATDARTAGGAHADAVIIPISPHVYPLAGHEGEPAQAKPRRMAGDV